MLESRTQITRHDCVEGWSCIGKWTGVPLKILLDRAGLKPNARYVVFHCADTMESGLDGGGDDDDSGTDSAVNDAKAGSKGNGQTKSGSTQGSGDAGQTAPTTAADEKDSTSSTSGVKFYGSIDLVDAYHPQTILAYDMGGAPLPVAHGAPLRLRLERQLGYKMSKYVMAIELVESFAHLGKGRGGYWEDTGYTWYAGI